MSIVVQQFLRIQSAKKTPTNNPMILEILTQTAPKLFFHM